MTCQQCGATLRDNAKFCPKCGAKAAIVTPSAFAHDVSAVWPEWQLEKLLGKGAYGTVYQAVRRDHGVESHAAIKVISIPTDTGEIDSLRSEGLDMDGSRSYFQGIVNDFVGEIQLMESLKGLPNIVSVEDYKVVEKVDTIGWDIYIRMELLTPFNAFLCDKTLTEADVIKIGSDVCTALEICNQRRVIHRDIKPENLFVNDFGHFKLGDFGIARRLENVTGGLSQKGTFNYMAPEVANGDEYDVRVDIYSLGIVLYRLLNDNRLPFLETEKQLLSPSERKNAVDRRLRGEALPTPCKASPAMADVILRACAYDPTARFAGATEMKQALTSVANGTYLVKAPLDKTVSVRDAVQDPDATMRMFPPPQALSDKTASKPTVNTFEEKPKKKRAWLISVLVIAAVAVLSALVGCAIWLWPDSSDGESSVETTATPTENVDSAAATHYSDGFYYTVSGVEATITDYDGTAATLTVPSVIDSYEVKAIGNEAFADCDTLQNVAVANGIATIGNGAFRRCASLERVTLPDSVSVIGYDVFLQTPLYDNSDNWVRGVLYIGNHVIRVKPSYQGSLTILEGAKTVADKALDGCSAITQVTVPHTVETIGYRAFYQCTALKTVTIPDAVTKISREMFAGCTSLEQITVGSGTVLIRPAAFSGCTSLKDVYYHGSKEEWQAIGIGEDNEELMSVTMHYE